MGYLLSLLLLHCLQSSIALPKEVEGKSQDVTAGQQQVSVVDDPEIGMGAHEIVTRVQDPTENLVCRLYKMKVPQGVIVVPTSANFPPGTKYLITPNSVGLREYLYSPAAYAALCVSPEKPKPFPLFFAPPPPLATHKPPSNKAPGVTTPAVAASNLNAPAPAISLVFSSPVGSIGIGSVSSPAVNIGTQSITDSPRQATWLVRRIVSPFMQFT